MSMFVATRHPNWSSTMACISSVPAPAPAPSRKESRSEPQPGRVWLLFPRFYHGSSAVLCSLQREFGIGAVQVATRLSPSPSAGYYNQHRSTKVAGRRVHLGRDGPVPRRVTKSQASVSVCQCVGANAGGLLGCWAARPLQPLRPSFVSSCLISPRCPLHLARPVTHHTHHTPHTPHTTHLVHAPLRAPSRAPSLAVRDKRATFGKWVQAGIASCT